MKIEAVPNYVGLNTKVYLRDNKLTKNERFFDIHSIEGSHWVLHINHHYFESYGYPLPKLRTFFITKGNKKRVFLTCGSGK